MIKLRNILIELKLLESDLPPGFSPGDFESIEDFVKDSVVTEIDLDAPVHDFPDFRQRLKKVRDLSKTEKHLDPDKFKYPYIHRSSIIDKNGNLLNDKKLKEKFTQRPKEILKRNNKIQKSGGVEYELYNISIPAFKGLIVDEKTGEFKIVDTCPMAGVCKSFCYARRGGYVQWEVSALSRTRTLNYLLNDWHGFKHQLLSEIERAKKRAERDGLKIAIRWHDSGDFMSEKYMKMAFDIAKSTPDILHYTYTKMIGMVSAADKPENFVFNFSFGSAEEEKIDPTKQKISIVVPSAMFKDFVVKNVETNKLDFKSKKDYDIFKKNMADKYHIPKDSILLYDELMKIPYNPEKDITPKYNVIVKKGDGDDAAMRKDVRGIYLLFH